MKRGRLPKGLQTTTVTPFSRGPSVEMVLASEVVKHQQLPAGNKDALWEWCRRNDAVLITFAPDLTWEDMAAEALSLGHVRMVVEDPKR